MFKLSPSGGRRPRWSRCGRWQAGPGPVPSAIGSQHVPADFRPSAADRVGCFCGLFPETVMYCGPTSTFELVARNIANHVYPSCAPGRGIGSEQMLLLPCDDCDYHRYFDMGTSVTSGTTGTDGEIGYAGLLDTFAPVKFDIRCGGEAADPRRAGRLFVCHYFGGPVSVAYFRTSDSLAISRATGGTLSSTTRPRCSALATARLFHTLRPAGPAEVTYIDAFPRNVSASRAWSGRLGQRRCLSVHSLMAPAGHSGWSGRASAAHRALYCHNKLASPRSQARAPPDRHRR